MLRISEDRGGGGRGKPHPSGDASEFGDGSGDISATRREKPKACEQQRKPSGGVGGRVDRGAATVIPRPQAAGQQRRQLVDASLS